jgi:hypothetical protein
VVGKAYLATKGVSEQRHGWRRGRESGRSSCWYDRQRCLLLLSGLETPLWDA